MELKHILENKLLRTIHAWEEKNDPSLPLDFGVFYTHEIYPEIMKNHNLQFTLLLDIPYIPSNVTKLIDCWNVKLQNILPSTLKSLSLSSSNFLRKSIPILPNSLEVLHIKGFFDQPKTLVLPSSLRILNYSVTPVDSFSNSELPPLPPALEFLQCTASQLCKLPTLPTTLKKIYLSHNSLKHLPELPASLEILDASHNALEELPTLPTSLRTLDVSSNCLHELPELPESLCDVSVNSNYLSKLPSLPSNLETLSCYNNNIEHLPSIIPPTLRFLIFYNNKFQSKPVLPNTVIEYLGGEFGNRIIPDNPSTEEERQGIMFEM
jgi:hypothetical protein